MPNIYILLMVIALLLTIGAGMGKVPVWVPLLLVVVALLSQALPR